MSAEIRLDAVNKFYGDTHVIQEMNARFEAGAFTVILGPSGCGKSTLLNMIAGLEHVSSGRILMDARAVQDLPPKERNLAMVFQNYALYPHMTVAENIGYALKIAGVGKKERVARITDAARAVALDDYLHRRPGELSGGQRQRVAIARAIVREPSVLLFDEPLSNLDAQLRHGTRMELAQLHRRIGATSIFVTHDQVEAMTLADRIMILNKGKIEQYDTPDVIYRRPATRFVAEFIGMPPMNLLNANITEGRIILDGFGLAETTREPGATALGIRPEAIRIKANGIPVRVDYVEDLGGHYVLVTSLSDGQRLQISAVLNQRPVSGETLSVELPADALHLFDAISGKRIDCEICSLAKAKHETLY
ncbi:sn-glycerol-3-phosphate ABC transporter ATP-binding protein UgpC [Ochrobactrum sp. P6BS-III]|uniref:ABC transporter ATP-binding protein n=1 Tax=unclassified Ochrobactrum TaxID=239106 RepID=UPI0009932E83|nr:sn-glycerol 3-phosphate transport system ATP-binding protein [Ochrobactrum sp. P6BSIII]OOL15746.1 sn-glycerol-3-phosphate ABC transporter ATP-binding protein UgpC [Ochrobactrum sp. P6BS-III]